METGNTYPLQQIYGAYNQSASPMSKTSKGDKNQQGVNQDIQQLRIQQEVQRLKITEQKVIAHETAHKSVAGRYAGPINYEYKRGPDGNMYISGGEVQIDASKGKTPEETIKKMEVIKRAALAPPDPSPQDIKIAAEAAAKEQEAKKEKQKEDSDLENDFEISINPTNQQFVTKEDKDASPPIAHLNGERKDDFQANTSYYDGYRKQKKDDILDKGFKNTISIYA